MARDLSIFLKPLSTSPEPGLDSADSRLAKIDELASHGQYGAAADKVEELIAESIYDIRPLSYYFFQAFFEGGLVALGAVLEAIASILEQSFEAVGPAKRRADHFNKRLGWLFDKMADALEYHEKNVTKAWDSWRGDLTVETLERAIHEAGRVTKGIAGDEYPSAGQRLGRLLTWLRGHAQVLSAAPQASPEKKHGQTSAVKAAAGATGEGAPGAIAVTENGSKAKVELVVSHQFVELCRKLRAFEILVEKGEFEKAALVSDDLMQTLEHFDPRAYFPELFARFGALFSKNIKMLAGHWEERDSVSWKALRQFYQIDLDGFIES